MNKHPNFRMFKGFIFVLSAIVVVACSELILEKDISKKIPLLLSPQDSSKLSSLTPSFWWEEIEGASQYQIQIVSPSFEHPTKLFVDTLITKNQFMMDLDTLAFQWRVRGINGGYKSQYSTASFSIDSGSVIEDRALKLLAPENNTYFKNQEIELKWEAATGVEKYNLVIEGDTTIDSNLSKTLTSIKIKFGANKNFKWKIIPINAPQYKESELYSFGTDTKVPATPTLTLPADNAIITTESVSFQWTSSDDNLSKNFIIVYEETGNSEVKRMDAGVANSLVVTKVDLGFSTTSIKRQWAILSRDKAGNESISAKRVITLQ